MRSAVRSICIPAAMSLIAWVGLTAPAAAQAPDDTQAPSQADQPSPDAAPPAGYVSATEGTARLERDGESNEVERGLPVVAGDRLRTEAGRVQITLADGTLLHLDRYSEIDLASDLVVRLGRGRLLVTMNGLGGSTDRLSVEAPGAGVRFDSDGQYRLAVGGEDAVSVELAVIRGSAEIASDAGSLSLGTGQRSRVRDGEAPSSAEWFNASSSTTLDRWADELMASNYQGGASSQGMSVSQTYLPSELDTYANTFDQYGSWQADATYGYVWYPTVAVDWRPYYHGRWDHMRRYGWTWIASDPWGYPTHHYGRWQLGLRGSWFWVPSRQWGPAWVYWATTPSYVGWCPLGWNGRPVLSVFTYGNAGHIASRRRDPFRAWTVMSTAYFGRYNVSRYHVDRTVLDRDQPAFRMQHVPPGFAPPRRPTSQRADGSGGGSWGAPVRRPGMSSPSGSLNPAPRPGYSGSVRGRTPGYGADTRVIDPGSPRQDSRPVAQPYDRARAYMDPRNTPSRTPYGGTYRRPDDATSTPYGPYAVPRRQPSSGDGRDNGGNSQRPASRPGTSAPPYRGPDSPGMSRPTDPGPRPGMSGPPAGYAAPRDPGGDRGGAPSRPSGGNDANRGGADGGSRGGGGGDGSRGGASPRRRP